MCVFLSVYLCVCLYDCVSVVVCAWFLPCLIFFLPHSACHLFSFLFMWVALSMFFDCVSPSCFLHTNRAFCLCLNVCLCSSPSVGPCLLHLSSLCLSSSRLSVFSPRRRLHNVPSSSLCDFAERGPGSGCHPLPPSQHCPRTLDQRHPAAHRLAALPHQPAPHLHRSAIRGAGARVRKHWALLPGVQRADGPLQRIWVCRIHEEGLCFTGTLWAAGSTSGTSKRICVWTQNTHIKSWKCHCDKWFNYAWLDNWLTKQAAYLYKSKQHCLQLAWFDSSIKVSRETNDAFESLVTSSHRVVFSHKTCNHQWGVGRNWQCREEQTISINLGSASSVWFWFIKNKIAV